MQKLEEGIRQRRNTQEACLSVVSNSHSQGWEGFTISSIDRQVAFNIFSFWKGNGTFWLIKSGITRSLRFCYYLAEEIKNMSLRVVTSSLAVMVELSSCPGISLFSLGGSFREAAGSFIGPAAEKALKGFQIETCFLGTTGISYDGKFSSQNTIEAQLKRSVLAACRRRVILADHSKYGETAFSIFAQATDIDVLIMDSAPADIGKLKMMDFELVLV